MTELGLVSRIILKVWSERVQNMHNWGDLRTLWKVLLRGWVREY